MPKLPLFPSFARRNLGNYRTIQLMYGQIHANRVLYKKSPTPGNTYRQIVVAELEQFQVRVLGGEVIQPDPRFDATSEDAEIWFFPDLQSALDHADKELKASVAAGWIPYVAYGD